MSKTLFEHSHEPARDQFTPWVGVTERGGVENPTSDFRDRTPNSELYKTREMTIDL